MTDYILPILIAVISSSALTKIVDYIITKIETKRKKNPVTSGLMMIMEDRIAYVAECYINRGYITPDELDRLKRMWNVYHFQLGGNGHLDPIMKLVDKLPIQLKL